MASRMERYYQDEFKGTGRSDKNKSLYKKIEDLDSYTNIEGVATIEKTNEIDISKVKELLKNRENYKKQRQLKNIIPEQTEEIEQIKEEIVEEKNYDINDIINKMKNNISQEEKKYRSLSEKQYNNLKKIEDDNYKKDNEELKELLNTIISKESLISESNDDVGLLDELKSNTVVGNASSIKKILDEEKNKLEDNTSEIDKSFYTSSFGFTKKDFEELRNINHGINKSNKFIIILLSALIILILAICVFFLIK